MDKPTLYMETTIPSFLLAEPSRDLVASGRQQITRDWWRRDHTRFDVFVSESILDEAAQGNLHAAKERLEFLQQFAVLPMTSDVRQAAELYLQKHIVPREKPTDALHLAFAVAHRI